MISDTRGESCVAGVLGAALAMGGFGCGTEGNVAPGVPPPPPPPSAVELTLDWATYIGGSGFEEGREPVALPGGRLLFGAQTFSGNLPTTPGAIQPTYGGGEGDTYLVILSSDGDALEAATYLGGSGMERPAYGLDVAGNGDIVVTSGTNSGNIPTTPGAYRTALNSPVNGGYVCRISGDLDQIRWCTYTAGWPRGGLTLTAAEEVIIVGRALDGSPFDATPGAYQTAKRGKDDAFVLKLTADGSAAVFKTRLGGTGDAEGEVAVSAHVVGNDIVLSGISLSTDFPTTAGAPQRNSFGPRDAFVARLSADGAQLRYSTLFGGSREDLTEHRDAVFPDGASIVGGETFSDDLPGAVGASEGGSDAWVARLAADGSAFVFVRRMGGSGNDRFIDRALDGAGRIILVGETSSSDFPVTDGALQPTYGGGGTDGIIVILDAAGGLLYSTYLGGRGNDLIRGVATGSDGTLFIVGGTSSDDFPISATAFQISRGGSDDAFAARLRIGS